MSDLVRRPLSSTRLYHFKRDVNVLKLILSNGFSHRRMVETIPFRNSTQVNFAVCFCDLRWEDSKAHQDCYGENAVVLSKDWAIARGVSPVRYIHETSPGARIDYLALKNVLRFARGTSEGNRAALIQDMIKLSLLTDRGALNLGAQDLGFADGNFASKSETEIDNEFEEFINSAKAAGTLGELSIRYLASLVQRIVDLTNELERRDSFTRRYREDFNCPAKDGRIVGKVLYDEREWRSIHYTSDVDEARSPGEAKSAEDAGYLPIAHNLQFNDGDMVAIVAKDQNAKNELRAYIESGATLLSGSFNRIYSSHEFHERMVEDA